MTSTPTTVDLDTELSAVNTILGSIGQAPISTLDYDNPEIAFIYNLLKESNQDVQNEGWHFNRENHVKQVTGTDNKIVIDASYIRIDNADEWDKTRDFVRRKDSDGLWKIYDKVNHTDVFTDDQYVNLVWLFDFEDLPSVFKRYITYKACGRAATQLVGNRELVQLLATQELQARAACMEYECNQGDHSFFGLPHESTYNSYQPYFALRR